METGINIIEWSSLPYCTMSAFGEDALQRNAMLHKSRLIIIDYMLLTLRPDVIVSIFQFNFHRVVRKDYAKTS